MMKKSWRLLVGILMFSSYHVMAQDQDADPIEEALIQCLDDDENQDTANMSICLQTAYDAYDLRLNEVFQELLGLLDDVSGELLRETQRQWLSFRDAEFALIDEGLYPPDGTMYSLFRLDDRVDFVRVRVGQLQGYLDAFTEFSDDR